ncbi:NAD(P)H-hydrate dehydratase [Candidatus Woesearchaeota archaeon]|nr:NAD(P)H-hydrate dehydratase [Candidatus Woesearchaeota archaeon]
MNSRITRKDLPDLARKKNSVKGDSGKVLVIGGSEGYTGAVYLAAMAAAKSGADWITVAAPEKVSWLLNAMSPDLVTEKLKGKVIGNAHLPNCLEMAKKHDVVLLGNGLGLSEDTKQFVRNFVHACKGLLVIDADALKAVSLSEVHNSILTPHLGEFMQLCRNSRIKMGSARQQVLREIKSDSRWIGNNVLLLKGLEDIIADSKELRISKGGTPLMSVAGTGDVLAGLCAGILAQSRDLFRTACLASRLNKQIGEDIAKKQGTLLASDLLLGIPGAMKNYS